MLVAPAIWPAVGDAVNEACGNPGRRRQFCDLSKVAEADIARFMIARLAKSEIVLPTLAVFGLVKWIQNSALNRAEDDETPILGTLPASTTSKVGSTATAWVVQYVSNEAELSKEMAAATIPLRYSALSESTTSTSLSCANTGRASVSASLAYDNVVSFCGQADHFIKIDSTSETSQSFPEQEQNSTLSVSWAAGCAGQTTEYTVTQDDCRTYLNDTINNCETGSNDKHGGSITAECIVFAMAPQPYIPPPPIDNPSSLTPDLPVATVKSLHCPSPTPMAMFNKDDAALAIDRACALMHDEKTIMAGQPPYLNHDPPHSPGSGASGCSTSSPNKIIYALIQATVKPFLYAPCNASTVPDMGFSDDTNIELCKTNLHMVVDSCGLDTQPEGQQYWENGGFLVQNCYMYTVTAWGAEDDLGSQNWIRSSQDRILRDPSLLP